jgi:hypothetical protein
MQLIRESFEVFLGPPVRTLRLRSSRISSTVPTELDILYFPSINCLPLWSQRQFTLVATAGLSEFSEVSPVEMCIRIDGRCSWESMDAIGRSLAELAIIPFREGCQILPLSVLEGIHFPVFSRMHHALVAHWSVTTPAWLPGLSPPVLLLLIVPLMQTELDWLTRFGPESTFIELERRGISIYDPLRIDAMEAS